MIYRVTLKKIEVYEVEAANAREAEDKACELCDIDMLAWASPADEIITEIIDEVE